MRGAWAGLLSYIKEKGGCPDGSIQQLDSVQVSWGGGILRSQPQPGIGWSPWFPHDSSFLLLDLMPHPTLLVQAGGGGILEG